MEVEGYFFQERYGCSSRSDKSDLQTAGPSRIKTIIESSKDYGDNIYKDLEISLKDEHTLGIGLQCHKNCVSRYTSKTNRKHSKSSGDASSDEIPPKKLRCSDNVFNFRKHCLFCPGVSECQI